MEQFKIERKTTKKAVRTNTVIITITIIIAQYQCNGWDLLVLAAEQIHLTFGLTVAAKRVNPAGASTSLEWPTDV